MAFKDADVAEEVDENDNPPIDLISFPFDFDLLRITFDLVVLTSDSAFRCLDRGFDSLLAVSSSSSSCSIEVSESSSLTSSLADSYVSSDSFVGGHLSCSS